MTDIKKVEDALKNNFQEGINDFYVSYVIFPDGLIISADIHADMSDYLAENGLINEYVWEEKGTDIFTEDYNCVRCAKAEKDENYVELPLKPLTNAQYQSLTEWLDDNSYLFYDIHITVNRNDLDLSDVSRIYSYDEYTVDEIIGKIKRYYAFGKLQECRKSAVMGDKVRKNSRYTSINEEIERQTDQLNTYGDLHIWDECTGGYDDQSNHMSIAYVGDNWIDNNDKIIRKNLRGYIDYAIYNDEIYIQMIEVGGKYRRQGIATTMINNLKRMYPGVKIHTGFTTNDGTEFFKTIKLDEVYPNKGESKKDFIARFMEVTKDEYPDIKQRYAVANSYWDRRDLKEAKEDIQKLYDYIKDNEYVNTFLELKKNNRIKSPENDIYYWLKKDPYEFKIFIDRVNSKKSNNQIKKDAKEKGVDLIYIDSNWQVYKINTPEAAQLYGKGTEWCITETDGYWWNDYKDQGVKFYYFISNSHDKYALAIYLNGKYCIYNETDEIEAYIEDAPKVKGLPDVSKINPTLMKSLNEYGLTEDLIDSVSTCYIRSYTDELENYLVTLKNGMYRIFSGDHFNGYLEIDEYLVNKLLEEGEFEPEDLIYYKDWFEPKYLDELEGLDESLLESKQDKENFYNWAKEAVEEGTPYLSDWERKGNLDYIVKLFDENRKNLEPPYNDYYFWIKSEVKGSAWKLLNKMMGDIVDKKKAKQKEKEGARLVYSDNDWKVYAIDTYEASKKYGANTKWCISGSKRWANGENGENYFNKYYNDGIRFYFFINKDTKYALCYDPDNSNYMELFNAEDLSIPYIPNAPKVPEIKVDYTEDKVTDQDRLANYIASPQCPEDVFMEVIRRYFEDEEFDAYIWNDVNSFLDEIKYLDLYKEDYVEWLRCEKGKITPEEYKRRTGEEFSEFWDGDTSRISEFDLYVLDPKSYEGIKYIVMIDPDIIDYGRDAMGYYNICECADKLAVIRYIASTVDVEIIDLLQNLSVCLMNLINEGSIKNWEEILKNAKCSERYIDYLRDKLKESLNEGLLTEATRQELINKSRNADNYAKGNQKKGKNRYERRLHSKIARSVRQYNRIDFDAFFKKDILTVGIEVNGETNNYVVSMRFEGALREIANEVKANNGILEFKTIARALSRTFNMDNVKIACTCLHPDTKIKLLDGTTPTVEEMCERFNKGEKLYVYSVDANGDFKPGEVEKVWQTGTSTEFVEITLDNGEVIRTTPDHPYMLRDGSYVIAKNLTEGTSLMPIYFNESNGYETFKPNTMSRGWKAVYKEVAKYFKQKEIEEAEERSKLTENKMSYDVAIHHKDFNKHNNNPENLEIMTAQEHWDYHANLCGKNRPITDRMREASRENAIKRNANPTENMKRSRAEWQEKGRLRNYDEDRKKQQSEIGRRNFEKYHEGWTHDDYSKRTLMNIKEDTGEKISNALKNVWDNYTEEEYQKRCELNRISNAKCKDKRIQAAKNVRKNKSQEELDEWKFNAGVSRIRKVIDAIFEHGDVPTEDNYDYYKKIYFKYGLKWQSVFSTWKELSDYFHLNHKIISVKFITLEETPVYDIKVKEWENFLVDAGVILHNCPDHRYRMAYYQNKNGYGIDQELRPSDITNPKDSKGAGCKHALLVLSNLDWMLKVASVVNNYIKYSQKNLQNNYATYIFPKIYGMPYKKAVQLSLFDDGLLPSDQELLTRIASKNLKDKDEKGKWVKGNSYRYQPTKPKGIQPNPKQQSLGDIEENEPKNGAKLSNGSVRSIKLPTEEES